MNSNITENAKQITNVPGYIAAAAEWWANAIYRPKFDNGDKSQTGDIATMLATMLNAKAPVTKEGAEAFKLALTELLMEEMEGCNYYSINVDYHPDPILFEAARIAKLPNTNCFPWKTQMHVEKNKVTVSAGYGTPCKVIWTEDN